MYTDEHVQWLQIFSPCGLQPVRGYGRSSCLSPDCTRLDCMARQGFRVAGFLINDASSLEAEQKDFRTLVRNRWLGREVVNFSGKRIRMSYQDTDTVVSAVSQRAQTIVEEVGMCVQTTDLLTQSSFAGLPDEQRFAAYALHDFVLLSVDFQGSLAQAKELETRTKLAVEDTLALGMGNTGLIARYAIIYGFADRVPQGAMTQIFDYQRSGELRPVARGKKFN